MAHTHLARPGCTCGTPTSLTSQWRALPRTGCRAQAHPLLQAHPGLHYAQAWAHPLLQACGNNTTTNSNIYSSSSNEASRRFSITPQPRGGGREAGGANRLRLPLCSSASAAASERHVVARTSLSRATGPPATRRPGGDALNMTSHRSSTSGLLRPSGSTATDLGNPLHSGSSALRLQHCLTTLPPLHEQGSKGRERCCVAAHCSSVRHKLRWHPSAGAPLYRSNPPLASVRSCGGCASVQSRRAEEQGGTVLGAMVGTGGRGLRDGRGLALPGLGRGGAGQALRREGVHRGSPSPSSSPPLLGGGEARIPLPCALQAARRALDQVQPGGRGGVLSKVTALQCPSPVLVRHGQTRGDVRAHVGGGELASSAGTAYDIIGNLGLDTLTFLAATVIIVPAFKSFKASPILGFLLSGVALNELGLIRNITDVKALSELGILFLLFEMGLELSIERLRALAKFAFGIGLPQVLLTTLAFTAFELPPNNALGTRLLQWLFGSTNELVNIRSFDEALVIGAALSLSSSAFVLQLLSEKGELATRVGSATLGILLLQDIAVVPLLVILPILETGNFNDDNLFPLLAAAGLKSLLGLGVLLLMGRLFLRRFFEFVAESRSSEAFVALCLLTVTGTSLITSKLGFSDSLGAFLAGAILAETNYRTQVEADIRPFRGLLLGLFFVTTGTSVDLNLLAEQWPNCLALLGGLIGIKTAILTLLGPRVGLTLAESVRTGLLLSQGGEFAFVVFALANQIGVLPLELNRLLIIVVVLSMALTPLLDAVGRKLADFLESRETAGALEAENASGSMPQSGEAVLPSSSSSSSSSHSYEVSEPIVILGFNQQGQVLANFLSSPLATVDGGAWQYVCFDLNPKRIQAGKRLGFPVLYGDGSRTAVLQSAGIRQPKAVLVVYSSRTRSVETVERLHHAFPSVPIFARAMDLAHMLELKRAGATDVVLESAETSLRLGSMLLQDLGVMRDDVIFLRGLMRDAMFRRAEETLERQRQGMGMGVGVEDAEKLSVTGPVIRTSLAVPPAQDKEAQGPPRAPKGKALALASAPGAAGAQEDTLGSVPTRAAAAAAALGSSLLDVSLRTDRGSASGKGGQGGGGRGTGGQEAERDRGKRDAPPAAVAAAPATAQGNGAAADGGGSTSSEKEGLQKQGAAEAEAIGGMVMGNDAKRNPQGAAPAAAAAAAAAAAPAAAAEPGAVEGTSEAGRGSEGASAAEQATRPTPPRDEGFENQMYFSDGEDCVDADLPCQGSFCQTEVEGPAPPSAPRLVKN